MFHGLLIHSDHALKSPVAFIACFVILTFEDLREWGAFHQNGVGRRGRRSRGPFRTGVVVTLCMDMLHEVPGEIHDPTCLLPNLPDEKSGLRSHSADLSVRWMGSFEFGHDRTELYWWCESRGAFDAIPESLHEGTHVRRAEELRIAVHRSCGCETSRRTHRTASPLRRSDVETVGGEVGDGEMEVVSALTQRLKLASTVVVREDTGTHIDGCLREVWFFTMIGTYYFLHSHRS